MSISRSAKSAQDAARQTTGEFGTQAHTDSGIVDLPGAPDTATPAPVGQRQISRDEVLQRWETGTRWTDDTVEEDFEKEYVEPVTAFGLQLRTDDHRGIGAWFASGSRIPDPVDVDLALVRYSTQAEGVLVSLLAAVIEQGTDEAPRDPEGWFDNPHPLLMRWADGSYSVRDGNHRCIGGRLRGDATILAHIIDEGWSMADFLEPVDG